MGQVTAREQTRTGAVYTHRLVTFILDCKGMSIADPAMDRILINLNAFLKVFARHLFKIGPHTS